MSSTKKSLLTRAWRLALSVACYGVGPNARQRKKAAAAKQRNANFFESQGWQHGAAESRRVYDSYEEYVRHQSAKLEQILPRLLEKEDKNYAEFKRRFEGCAALREARSVLCLGARLGTEVRALHALGHFAVGIDLNPGEGNPYVLRGDFHAIVFPDGSLDAIYTNVLDHVFALDRLVGEVRRLLRPGGAFILDLVRGYEEGYVPGEFEVTIWRDRQSFIERIRELGGFTIDAIDDLDHGGCAAWTQVVFRKPMQQAIATPRKAAGAQA